MKAAEEAKKMATRYIDEVIFSGLIEYSRTATESLQDQWDLPATIQGVRLANPERVALIAESLELAVSEREAAKEEGLEIEISLPFEINGHPFESLVGISLPQDVIGLLFTFEGWTPPLDGLRPHVTPTLAADGRQEIRTTILMLRNGLEASHSWVRGAGWMSDIGIDTEAPQAIDGRVPAALRLTLGLPSGLDLDGPAETLAEGVLDRLLNIVWSMAHHDERRAGEFISDLRDMAEADDVNIIQTFARCINDPWVDALAGAASWAEVKDRVLAVLAEGDHGPTGMEDALRRELSFDSARPVDEVARWADGDMFCELFNRHFRSTTELRRFLGDLEQPDVTEAFLDDLVKVSKQLQLPLMQEAQSLVSDS